MKKVDDRVYMALKQMEENARICKEAARKIEQYANSNSRKAWVEQPDGENVILQKDSKINTAEFIPLDPSIARKMI